MDFAIDPITGGLAITDGQITAAAGIDEVSQRLRIRLRTFLGEYLPDPSFGVPYIENVLVKNPSMPLLNATFTRAILDTPDVLQLLTPITYDLDRRSRKMSIAFKAKSSLGVISFSEALP